MREDRSHVRMALIGIALLMALGMSQGCANLKRIPLFNPQARTLNKIASANEFINELNQEVSQMRDDGLVTQSQINHDISPSIDSATAIVDESEVLYRAGKTVEADGKVASAKAVLQTLKASLEQIKRSKP